MRHQRPVNQKVLRTKAERSRQTHQGQPEYREEDRQAGCMFRQAQMSARCKVLSEADLDQPKNTEQAHSRDRYYEPVHKRAGDPL